MLAQFSGQMKADGRLNLAASDGVLLVVVGQAGRLGCNALEDVVHEGVHDAHSLARDSSVGVDLLQDLVDVDRVALLARLSLLLLLTRRLRLGGCCLLLSLLGSDLARHDERFLRVVR